MHIPGILVVGGAVGNALTTSVLVGSNILVVVESASWQRAGRSVCLGEASRFYCCFGDFTISAVSSGSQVGRITLRLEMFGLCTLRLLCPT